MKLCECGCGRPAPIAIRNDVSAAIVKGQSRRFIHGHNRRGTTWKSEEHPQWRGDKAGYAAMHNWIRRHKPRVGICEWCGERRQTQMANLSGNYRRDVSDFAELCVPCHRRFDLARAA